MSAEVKKKPGQKKPHQQIKTLHKDTVAAINRHSEKLDDKGEYIAHAAMKLFDALPVAERVAAVTAARVELASSNYARGTEAEAAAA